ncbi:MAG: DUF1501 domain-containing protein [Alteromonadaceae bacterium]|nr:DUF1501 domain-containing protein [Alteromonadaceae bacterium]
MDRRNFIKAAGISSLVSTLPASFQLYAAPEDYTGKFLINVQAEGGWDVTSFCDPKTNTAGEPEINHWARNAEIQQAGNLLYAPFAANAAFFDKYYRDILIINGVDAQTNSHTAGVIHNMSGRISEGFPSLTALFAAQNGTQMPIALINNGGFSDTGGLTRYTRIESINELGNIIYPNVPRWAPDSNWVHTSDWQRIQNARDERLASLNSEANLTARQLRNRQNYRSSIDNAGILSDFASAFRNEDNIQGAVESGNFYSTFRRQIQTALLAMSSGVTVAADLLHWGFDTHENHDNDHNWLLTELTGALDYLWTYAEQLGVADRLVVVVSSDFGRTNFYNEINGKDHWPIGSYMVMERNQSYTNRSIGLTDEIHNTVAINPNTHQADSSGSYIFPMHVMHELRQYLQVDSLATDNSFSLNPPETFGFFS